MIITDTQYLEKDIISAVNFVNTRQFSDAAMDFKRNKGLYTLAPVGSREYVEYWDMQEERCRNGFKSGGIWISGRHYFYLNFTPILKVPDKDLMKILAQGKDKRGKLGAVTMEKILEFPRFFEIDYEWYRFKHIAWNGGKFQHITSPGGKNIACAKTRGCGFSYKESSDGVYNYTFIPDSKSYYFASLEQFLIVDGIMNKCQGMADWINVNIPYWLQNRMEHNTLMHMKASYIDEFGAKKGNMSELIGVVVDNPNKTRGKRGKKIVFEESGSFKKLKEALAISVGAMKDGGFKIGQISVFGCVCAGTEVYTAEGNKVLVENLKQQDGILGYNGRGISQEPIVWMQPPAAKECVEITLENGVSLKCSIDHPILATHSQIHKQCKYADNRRRVKFIEAEKLKKGYQVALISEVPIFGNVNIPEAYTLGYLIGDGYYGGTVECIVDNEVSRKQIFDDSSKIELKRKYSDTLISYSIGGNIRQLLRREGMLGQSKLAKRLPVNWRSYNKETLAALLAGYFDADGNIKWKRTSNSRYLSLVYTSIVPELVAEVREALLKFGVHSIIVTENSKGGYTEKHTLYRLYINRAFSLLKFRENIKPLHPNKQIPVPPQGLTQSFENAKEMTGKVYDHSVPLTNAQLYKVIAVKSIGKQPVYNLTAGNTHTYLANNIITHNTGGEEGPSIEGLEDIWNEPHVYDMLAFKNIWEEGMEGNDCGYFVPATKANIKCMDEDGNVDIAAAMEYEQKQRDIKAKAKDVKELDRYKAEYPIYPSEVFQRLAKNPFRVAEIDKQINRIQRDAAIQALLRHGQLNRGEKGVEFNIQTRDVARPIEEYPHNQRDSLEGCVTIVERPYLDQKQKVPDGMYQIIFDPYYKEESEDLTSLFAVYVLKQYNNIDTINEGLPVAWFVGRPADLNRALENLFMLSDWYNCNIQGEIAGGGQAVLDYAKRNKLLHKLDFEIEMTDVKEVSNRKIRSYLMNMPTEKKRQGLTYLINWHMEPRGLNEDGSPILNIHRIYDIGLLREMRKFDGKKNADRISAMIVGMYSLREKVVHETSEANQKDDFYSREMFAETTASDFIEKY